MTAEFATILDQRCFLEAPRWHDGRLWVSDFYLGEVLSLRQDGSDVRVEAQVPNHPSGLGWLPDGRLLIVSMHDRRVLRREADGTLVTHADLSALTSAVINDMTVDAAGNAYVGGFGFDLMAGDDVSASPLYLVRPDGDVEIVAEELWFPNGSVITEDGRLLVNETFGNRVSSFDIQPDATLGTRQTWAEFGPLPTSTTFADVLESTVVASDGCGLDAEGALWIADALGNRAIRVTEGATILDEVDAGTGVYACTVTDDSLVLCTAPDFAAEDRAREREGRLFRLPVKVAATS